MKTPEFDGTNTADFHTYLARRANIRLPRSNQKLTVPAMRKWLKSLSSSHSPAIALNMTERATGEALRLFVQANPSWNLRQWAGLVLERVYLEQIV